MPLPDLVRRAPSPAVALESTLLAHGVPPESALPLADDLERIVRAEGAHPAVVAVLRGSATVGLTREELSGFLTEAAAGRVPKVNTANLGAVLAARGTGATTVSATMELAAAAGLRVFATGGLGGVHHRSAAAPLDVSADLFALTRFPVAVVCSGVKSILDVVSTREVLEALGVPCVGFRTDRFPAFYLRESPAGLDARFDDVGDLASYLRAELSRTGRGVLVASPVPEADAIDPARMDGWLRAATSRAAEAGAAGRDVTPTVLAALHELSGGATLRANLALVKSNAWLAASLARAMHAQENGPR